MSREAHVRICEGVGVRFPHATRLLHLPEMTHWQEEYGQYR
jgi:hypothetical protein